MKISIRTNILIVFFLGTLSISFILLFSQYYFSKKIALESTEKSFIQLSQILSKKIAYQEQEMKRVLRVMGEHKIFFNKIVPFAEDDLLLELTTILELKPRVKSLFYTDTYGSFFEVFRFEDDPFFKKFNAPLETKWVVVVIVSGIEYYIYYDKDLQVLTHYGEGQVYSFTTQQWYQAAMDSKNIVISKPYLFHFSNKKGITYSKKIASKRVIGVDCKLETFSKFLESKNLSQTITMRLIDEKKGKALASKKITLVKENDKYFYQTVLSLNNGEYLSIRVDAQELLAPYKKNLLFSLAAALVLILFFIPVIFMGTSFLIKPIKKLILENKNIAKRRFEKVKPIDTNIIEFDALSRSLVQMAQSIQTYQSAQEKLLDAIIQLIAEAIDTKSPYTGGHCRRVPELAMMLLKEADKTQHGTLKDFTCKSKEARKEFELAAWLHDCGKVTTPEYVVDKATKLETIYNRIHEIRMRFEVLLRDAKIAQLEGSITSQEYRKKEQHLVDDFTFIASVNLGGEFLDEEKIQRVHTIAKQTWMRHFDDRLGLGEEELQNYSQETTALPVEEYLLSDKQQHKIKRVGFDYEKYTQDGFKEDVPELLYNLGEVYNLCIQKGTLTAEERFKINEHVIMTIKMLEKIPFPSYYSKIPEYAGNHHETLRGDGYPRKLTKEELSIPSRILAIADIFEALSASDRPYKKAKKLSECIKIMSFMAQEQQIDPELFKLFIESGIYEKYAQRHFAKDMIDEVAISWV